MSDAPPSPFTILTAGHQLLIFVPNFAKLCQRMQLFSIEPAKNYELADDESFYNEANRI